MMKNESVHTHIGDISLNSRHYASLSEAEAVSKMKADGVTTDDGWAKKAYVACANDVKKADKKKD